jgi:hypothetical protein
MTTSATTPAAPAPPVYGPAADVVIAWATAAGGTVGVTPDGALCMVLPPLPECPALWALRKVAAEEGVPLVDAPGAGGRA